MIKLVDFDGNEIAPELNVLLWSGDVSGYSIPITLSESAYNYKQLILIVDDKYSIKIDVLDGGFYVNATPRDYRQYQGEVMSYDDTTKTITIEVALWCNETEKLEVKCNKIYGTI